MKKLILIFVLIMVSGYGGFSKKLLKKSLQNMPYSQIVKTTKQFTNSQSLKKILQNVNMTKYTPIDKLVKTAEEISKKSNIHSKIMSIKEPFDAMYIYSKGGDKIFNSIYDLSKKSISLSKSIITKINTNLPKISGISKLSQKDILEKSIKVLKASGKKGLEIVKGIANIAKNNTKSTIAGVMYAWFLTDPQGFKEKLDEFGGSLEEFATYIGGLTGKTTVGVTKGFFTGLSDGLKGINWTIMALFLAIGILFMFRKKLNIQRIYNKQIVEDTSKKRGGRF